MDGLSRYFMFMCIGFLFGVCLIPTSAELERFEYPMKGIGSISFLVVGDWGRRGAYNQSKVAHQMGKVADDLQTDFVISTGDNFYENGLTSVDDPAFLESFTMIYTAKSLHTQWYSVLGNHDYRGNVEAQLSPVLGQTDSRWFCKRSFVLYGEIAEFFFVDTTPFVEKYFLRPRKHKYDWRGVLPRKQYLANLTNDLDLALRESKANWKIVVGHHTIKSMGHHGHTMELELKLLPILKANNVDMYINGHDHCLQHISSRTSNIHFLTSGGGSKAWKGDIKNHRGNGLKFYYDGQGFISVQLTPTNVKAMFHDVSGEVIYDLSFSKALSSAI